MNLLTRKDPKTSPDKTFYQGKSQKKLNALFIENEVFLEQEEHACMLFISADDAEARLPSRASAASREAIENP